MRKPAPTESPIHELLANRWSLRAFQPKAIDAPTLRSLFEAARWAASSANEQPWRFIVVSRDDAVAFQRLLECLVPGNQRWAANAGALVLTVARMTFERNDKPNPHAWHDCGMAIAQLWVEATARGLGAHVMAGFERDKAREVYQIPPGFEPVTVAALGYGAEPDSLPDDLRQRETAARQRRPLRETVFGATWNEPAPFLDSR